MFISSASVDDNEAFVEREYEAGDLSSGLVADLVRSLDGSRHTLVTLSPGGESHMAIGGDAGQGLVVYVTSDNMVFYNLRTNSDRPQGIVTLVAGGQPGDYDSSNVVTLEEGLTAAIRYAETGMRTESLVWDIQQAG
jgi:immunity protein Imm1 of predicted polymorphic toxin system